MRLGPGERSGVASGATSPAGLRLVCLLANHRAARVCGCPARREHHTSSSEDSWLHPHPRRSPLRAGSGGSGSLKEMPIVQFPSYMVKVKSPYAQHHEAYTAYEVEVRKALAAEDVSFNICKFEAAATKWVGTIKHALPVKSLPISRMSDSIVDPCNASCNAFEKHLPPLPGVPKDEVKTPADLKVLFAEEIVTLASLLDKEFFVSMMRSAGNGKFGLALYPTAMAWVWALLKLDFDPEGTPFAEDRTKHLQEQDRFSDKSKKLSMQMCREIVRKEGGDEAAEMWYKSICATLGIDA